jgi:parallel beta-helix repeat protein
MSTAVLEVSKAAARLILVIIVISLSTHSLGSDNTAILNPSLLLQPSAVESNLPPTVTKQEIISSRDRDTRVWEITKWRASKDSNTPQTNLIPTKSHIIEKGCGICYRDARGNWGITDNNWVQTATGFVMNRANYSLSVGFTADSKLSYVVDGRELRLAAVSVEVDDGKNSAVLAQIGRNINGHIDQNAKNVLVFSNAFGTGIDLQIAAESDGYHQNVVFNTRPVIPTGIDANTAKFIMYTNIDSDEIWHSQAFMSGKAVVAKAGHSGTPQTRVVVEANSQPMALQDIDQTASTQHSISFVVGDGKHTKLSHQFVKSEVYETAADSNISRIGVADKQLSCVNDGSLYLVESIGASTLNNAHYPVVWDYHNVSGTITQNQTWYADSTYYLSGNVTLSTGVTLTIEPGTIIKIGRHMPPPASPGFPPASPQPNCLSTCNGTLIAKGQPYRYIIFTSARDPNVGEIIDTNVPQMNDWGYVDVKSSSTVEFCKFAYAEDGLDIIWQQQPTGSICHNMFTQCWNGICVFDIFGVGGSGVLNIWNNLIYNCQTGIWAWSDNSKAGKAFNIYNNTICNTGTGIDTCSISSLASTTAFKNNLIANSTHGIKTNPVYRTTSNYNAFYNCTTKYYGSTLPGTNDVSLNSSPFDSDQTYLGLYFLNKNANGGELVKDAGDASVSTYYSDPNQWSIYPIPQDGVHYFGSDTTMSSAITWQPNYSTCDVGTVAIGYHHPRVDYGLYKSVTFSGSSPQLTIKPGTIISLGGGPLNIDGSLVFSAGKLLCNGTAGLNGTISIVARSFASEDWRPISQNSYYVDNKESPSVYVSTNTANGLSASFTSFAGLLYGMGITSSNAASIHDNEFFHNTVGLYFAESNGSNCLIENNLFTENFYGMFTESDTGLLKVRNCTFDRNVGYSFWADSGDVNSVSIENCIFSNADLGLVNYGPALAFSERYNAFYNLSEDYVNSSYRSPDLDDSGFVDFKDFAIFAQNWLHTGSNLSGDFNGSGTVDMADLAIFANSWLTTFINPQSYSDIYYTHVQTSATDLSTQNGSPNPIDYNDFYNAWTDCKDRFYLPQTSRLINAGDPCSPPMWGYTTDPNMIILDTDRRDIGYHYPVLVDHDNDGLYDYQEYWLGTNPYSVDTDNDGLVDGYSGVVTLAAYQAATGHSGVDDGTGHVVGELSVGTDPTKADTDGDGMPDGWEVAHGLNPLVNDANGDPDGDGVSNLFEYKYGTDPHSKDIILVPSQAPTINAAQNVITDGYTIVLSPGTYQCEGIWRNDISIKSIDPNNDNIVQSTIINTQYGIQSGGTRQSGFFGVTVNGSIFAWQDISIINCHVNVTGGYTPIGIRFYYGSPLVKGCTIRGIGTTWGVEASSNGVITGNKISNQGLGIYCDNSAGSLISDNFIYNNETGIDIEAGTPEIANNTITKSTIAGIFSTVNNINVYNCILWQNVKDYRGCNVSYSCSSQCQAGTGNISSDPQFVNADANDFHILPTSPCRDAGDPTRSYASQIDIDGQPRLQGQRVDMGADEVYPICNSSTANQYGTIQAAINDAQNGQTILVGPGLYKESLSIFNKSITIQNLNPADWNSVAATVLDASGSTFGISINSASTNSIAVKGLSIVNAVAANGAAINILNSNPLIYRCLVNNNCNGMFCYNSSPTIIDNKIGINSNAGILATSDSVPVIKNNWIYKNYQGVAYSGANGVSVLRNNTIADNLGSGVTVTSGVPPAISDSIIWHNGDDLNGCQAIYSCISYNDSGIGNIHTNPIFVNSSTYNYHLEPNSPCIDSGDTTQNYSGETDIDGEPRIVPLVPSYGAPAIVDIGADEVVIYRVYNKSNGIWYSGISESVNTAASGDVIEVTPGTYHEMIDINNKSIVLQSMNPTDSGTVNSTIIDATGLNYAIRITGSSNCVVDGLTLQNSAANLSSGLIVCDNSSVSILHCNIFNSGNGVYCLDTGAPTIQYNRIHSCSNAGIYSVAQLQPTILDNYVYNCGTGVCLQNSSTGAQIRNDTITNNNYYGVRVISGSLPAISNCILWNNNDDLSGCNATYSCISNNDLGQGNIHLNPLFVDANSYNFALSNNSPCIDAGNPTINNASETDIYNQPRYQNTVDIGADEADPRIQVDSNAIVMSLEQNQFGTRTFQVHNNGATTLNVSVSLQQEDGELGLPDANQDVSVMKSDALAGNSSAQTQTVNSTSGLAEISNQRSLSSGGHDTYEADIKFNTPVLSRLNGYDTMSIAGLQNFGLEGEPLLPMRTVQIMVPAGKRVAQVTVTPVDIHDLPRSYHILPGQKAYPLSYSHAVKMTEPNATIYSRNKTWPGYYHKSQVTQSKRGLQIFPLNLYPAQYIPKTGKISYSTTLHVVVTFTDSGLKNKIESDAISKQKLSKLYNSAAISTYPLDQKVYKHKLRNKYTVLSNTVPSENNTGLQSQPLTYSTMASGQQSILANLQEGPCQYVIITNEALANMCGAWTFETLRDSKIARGISATIVTTDWIYANYSGLRPDGKTDNQTKIRNFLIDAYQNWGTEYTLLGGSNSIIPARKFFVYKYDSTDCNIPCDMYYGCVDPSECTFDGNRNGIYGEPTDGIGGGDVDLYADIYVGRICVQNTEDVENFVKKDLVYISTPETAYLSKVSMVGQYLGFGGVAGYAKSLLEEIRLGSSAEGTVTSGFVNHTQNNIIDFNTSVNLYQFDQDWTTSDFLSLINNGTHIFCHLAHSDPISMGDNPGLLTKYDIPSFTNDKYFFMYSEGCEVGWFDGWDTSDANDRCFADALTVAPNGAFGTIMNARYGLGSMFGDGPCNTFARQFWNAVLGDGIFEVGRANQDGKEAEIGTLGNWENRWTYYELNLFGDPEQKLRIQKGCQWLTVDSNVLAVVKGQSCTVTLRIDSNSLVPGTYKAQVCLLSNDPCDKISFVSVVLNVYPSNLIVSDTIASVKKCAQQPCTSTSMTLSNGGLEARDWESNVSPAYLRTTPAFGSLAPGHSTSVMLTADSNVVNRLNYGVYDFNVAIIDKSSGYQQKRQSSLIYSQNYFTEIFDSDNPLDLHYVTITLEPNSTGAPYVIHKQNASSYPTDPNGGTKLVFSEYDYGGQAITLTSPHNVFLYGKQFNSLYIFGDGVVALGQDFPDLIEGDVEVQDYFDAKVVAGLYSWLAPWDGGTVSYKESSDHFTITYDSVPEMDFETYNETNKNSFQIELFYSGLIRLTYLNTALSNPSLGYPAITGLSAGNGVPSVFVNTDFTQY